NKCSLSDCNKIIDPVIFERRFSESSSQSSGTSALADRLGENLELGSPTDVLPLLGQKDLPLYESKPQKKQLKDDSVNKDLIFASQLSEDSYTYLYKEIVKAEADNDITSQTILNCYFQFGKKLSDRLDYYKIEKNIGIV
ncbi:6783_t:CDS:2, partial [Gigaspora margarita]